MYYAGMLRWLAQNNKQPQVVETEHDSKKNDTPAVDAREGAPKIVWTTIRVDRKEKTITRRKKAESGSPFKNWLIFGKYNKADITMHASHETWSSLHTDIWYDFELLEPKVKVAPYWIGAVRENGRADKLRILESVNLCLELGHIILEYSFPMRAAEPIRSKRPARILKNPVSWHQQDKLRKEKNKSIVSS
jgi:hypothetical protein